MIKKSILVIIGLVGFGLTFLAIFANWFGLDMDNNWGKGRVLIFVTSLLILVIFFCILTIKFWVTLFACIKRRIDTFLSRLWVWTPLQRLRQNLVVSLAKWKAKLVGSTVCNWYTTNMKGPIVRACSLIRDSRWFHYFSDSQDRASALVAGILGVIILLIYIWYISLGLWTKWPATSNYYATLADAFWHGQTSLLQEPHPSLLALPDPYQEEDRQGFPYLWDAVLYNGKYYLYWGPVPALIMNVIRFVYSGEIGDQVLAFCFILGELVINILLLLKIRKKLFPNFTFSTIIPGIIIAGLANPTLWMLTRAKVYETAIAGGQFFLMTSFYLAFSYMTGKNKKNWQLILIGTSLILSIACRMSLAPAAIFLLIMLIWHIFQTNDYKWRKKALQIVVMGIPIAAGALALGWYNWIRFGSWLEFGQRYQLTTTNQNLFSNITFSWKYIPINLYNYLFNPFGITPVFPFLRGYWESHFVFFPVNSPKDYFIAEPVSGLILVLPYVLFCLIAVFSMAWVGGKTVLVFLNKKYYSSNTSDEKLLQWTLFTLIGICIFTFAPILSFFAANMRYLGDVSSWLVLLATLGSWLGFEYLSGRPRQQRWFWGGIVFLMLVSVLFSSLLAISGVDWRMEKFNPELYYRLVHFFSLGR